MKTRCSNNNYFPRKHAAWEILAMTARFVEVICNFDQVVPDIGRRKNPSQTMVRTYCDGEMLSFVEWQAASLWWRREFWRAGSGIVLLARVPLSVAIQHLTPLRYVGDMTERNIIIFVKL